jgi:hypothetical protein
MESRDFSEPLGRRFRRKGMSLAGNGQARGIAGIPFFAFLFLVFAILSGIRRILVLEEDKGPCLSAVAPCPLYETRHLVEFFTIIRLEGLSQRATVNR